jgi:hypothetical protein
VGRLRPVHRVEVVAGHPTHTLVLDSIGFIDTTWIGRGGHFHTSDMHIVERFRREGDAIFYDLTLEDPEVLAQPTGVPDADPSA